jgi:hypothetical protein
VVNATLERDYYRRGSALGKRIKFGRPQDKGRCDHRRVVADQSSRTALDKRVKPEAFALHPGPRAAPCSWVRGVGGARLVSITPRVRAVDAELADRCHHPRRAGPRLAGDQRFRTTLLAASRGWRSSWRPGRLRGRSPLPVARAHGKSVSDGRGSAAGHLFAMVMRDGLRPVLAERRSASSPTPGRPGAAPCCSSRPADPATRGDDHGPGDVALAACALRATRPRVDPLVSSGPVTLGAERTRFRHSAPFRCRLATPSRRDGCPIGPVPTPASAQLSAFLTAATASSPSSSRRTHQEARPHGGAEADHHLPPRPPPSVNVKLVELGGSRRTRRARNASLGRGIGTPLSCLTRNTTPSPQDSKIGSRRPGVKSILHHLSTPSPNFEASPEKCRSIE